jgi:hypothetical protein
MFTNPEDIQPEGFALATLPAPDQLAKQVADREVDEVWRAGRKKAAPACTGYKS